MGQVECMTHETDCISHRCSANEHVSQGICIPCPDGLSRAAGDDPLAGDTTCEDNFIDLCPNDANKIEPGLCGCGRPDRVENGDGTANCGAGRCARDQFVEDGRCFDCPEGTYRDEPAVIARGDSACTDIDECESDPCDVNATCTNRFGGFSCRCEPGFEGDGLSCKPRVDEVSGSHEAPPRLNDLPFSDLLPSFPQYRIPTLDDCHWTIENGVAQSRHGLDDIDDEHLVGAAYRASIEAGHVLPIRFCVYDNAGQAVFGGGYSQYGNRSIFVRDGEGYLPLEAEFVGLTDTAEMQIGWDVKWGKLEHLGLYNIGLRGPNDSFIIRANSGIGTLIIDGCWWLASRSYAPGESMQAAVMRRACTLTSGIRSSGDATAGAVNVRMNLASTCVNTRAILSRVAAKPGFLKMISGEVTAQAFRFVHSEIPTSDLWAPLWSRITEHRVMAGTTAIHRRPTMAAARSPFGPTLMI